MMSRLKASITLAVLLCCCAGGSLAQTPVVAKPIPPSTKAAVAGKPVDTAGAPVEFASERKKPVRNPALYSTRVELLSQAESARNAAYARALVQVVNQLTGQTNASSNPVVRGAMANAPKWVINSNQSNGPSDSEGNTLVGGAPVLKASLQVSFDPNPIDSLIAAAGYSYWTGERPKPLLWLSIDDGRGARLITSQQLNVIKSLADRGKQRGLSFLVPQGTPQELAAVQSIVNLDIKALTPLHDRYRNDTMLIGKVYRSVSGWSAWWLLSQNGVELARWPITDADARKVIASGADFTADYFAKRDSSRLDAGRSGIVMMEIQSIDSLDDYVRAITYLQTHASIRSVDVEMVMPGKIGLRVDLRSGVNAFRGLMRTSSVLQPLGSTSMAAPISTVSDDPSSEAPVPIVHTVERFVLKH